MVRNTSPEAAPSQREYHIGEGDRTQETFWKGRSTFVIKNSKF